MDLRFAHMHKQHSHSIVRSFEPLFCCLSSRNHAHAHGRFQQNDGIPRGPDFIVDLEVTLRDLYEGRQFTVAHRKQTLCSQCRGTGARKESDIHTCNACKGTGRVTKLVQFAPGMQMQTQETCGACGGKGKMVKSVCPHCKGTKVEISQDDMYVVVERGMKDGERISFAGECDESPDYQPGDLIFAIKTLPHPLFRRDQDNLHVSFQISLLEALVGFERTLSHLDGHVVVIARDQVTPYGHVIEIAGEGMPVHNFPSQRGSLFVTIVVEFPIAITQQQKDAFKTLLK
jgi:DnaJ-related protein SCJ1